MQMRARAVPAVLVIASCTIGWLACNARLVSAQALSAGEEGRGGPSAAAQRSLTLNDLVRLREVTEQQIAPNGLTVAFVVKEARWRSNSYVYNLFTIDARGGVPRQLISESGIDNLRWKPDGSALTYIGSRYGTRVLLTAPPRGRVAAVLFRPTSQLGAIGAYEWSPTGDDIALTATPAPSSSRRSEVERNGVVYSSQLTYRDLIAGSWLSEPTNVYVLALRGRRLRRVWQAPGDYVALSWAPSGAHLALSYEASRHPSDWNNIDVGIIDIPTGHFRRVASGPGVDIQPTFSPSGGALALSSQVSVRDGALDPHINSLFVIDVRSAGSRALGSASDLSDARILGWTADGGELLYERNDRSTSSLFALRLATGAIRSLVRQSDHLSRCTLARRARIASCVAQTSMIPPEIAIVDLADGTVERLTQLNPEFASIRLGEVRELRWTNRYGNRTNGFLVMPVGYTPGNRYPLLVILYGFDSGFIGQAQWITSYPAQAFATNGFAVLLMNYPPRQGARYGDFGAAAFEERDNPLASIEAAVDTVVAMGLADSAKMGIMGWSTGSFFTDQAITHCLRFKVASSGETAWRNPSLYWLGGARWAYYERGIFGGPPVGEWYANYRQLSPVLARPRLDVPVLREYESHSIEGLEYALWIDQGAPVEMVFYPDEEHVFQQPVHRLASMRRNLDWFNFWLRGAENPMPADSGQLQRWRTLRERVGSVVGRPDSTAIETAGH